MADDALRGPPEQPNGSEASEADAGENPLWSSVPKVVNELAREVIGVAIGVHDDIGPGVLENPYKLVLADRLVRQGHKVEVERVFPLEIEGRRYDRAYVADIVVDGVLIVETKCATEISFTMIKQVKTYLRLSGCPLGLILNFRVPRLYLNGIRRIVP